LELSPATVQQGSGQRRHPLALGNYQGMPIISAAEAVKRIAASERFTYSRTS
jgi:hypothetical protein